MGLSDERIAEMCGHVVDDEQKAHLARCFGISREPMYKYLRQQ